LIYGLGAISASTLDLLAFSPPGWGATLLAGLANSLIIALGAYSLGLVIGLCGAFGKLYGGEVIKDVLGIYTTIVRAVPELVLILFLFYAFTGMLNGLLLDWGYDRVVISPLLTGIAVLAVVQGAYSTEVLRGAILAVPKGQAEAALAYALPRRLVLWRIVLPQMIRHAIPGFSNNWLIMLKASALVSIIGLDDMVHRAGLAAASTRSPFTFYVAVALIYLALTTVSIFLLSRLEARYSLGVKKAQF